MKQYGSNNKSSCRKAHFIRIYLLANKFTSFSETSSPPNIINRSITFLSSLIFPVQSYSCNNKIAFFEKFLQAIPCSSVILSLKYLISKGISSLRSFNAGTLIYITANLWYKSSLKFPLAISCFKFLLVAANTLTFTLIS